MQRDHHADHLLFFTRFPHAGAVKARLATDIGNANALAAHDAMTRYCLDAADAAAVTMGASLHLLTTGASPAAAADWLGMGHRYIDQGDGDLGDRVARALRHSIARGARRIVVVGSDCPALSAEDIVAGFQLLTSHDVALGPATDGGFYLLGINANLALRLSLLLVDLPWGTDCARSVLERNAMRHGIRIGRLPLLSDVDRLADIDPIRWPWLAAAAGLLPQAAGG